VLPPLAANVQVHYISTHQNKPAVKKCVALKKAIVKKDEMQGGGQEIAVVIG